MTFVVTGEAKIKNSPKQLRSNMAINSKNQVAYGLDALPEIFNAPKVALRAPTTRDKAPIGTIWINATSGSEVVYCLVAVANNAASWIQLSNGGGFVNIVATGSISAGTTITAGTGLTVTTGGAAITGNSTVTGTLGSTGILSAATGTAVTAGGATYIRVGTGATSPNIAAGSGAPTYTTTKGSLYLRTDGSGVGDRIYVATDAAGTWTAITTVA